MLIAANIPGKNQNPMGGRLSIMFITAVLEPVSMILRGTGSVPIERYALIY